MVKLKFAVYSNETFKGYVFSNIFGGLLGSILLEKYLSKFTPEDLIEIDLRVRKLNKNQKSKKNKKIQIQLTDSVYNKIKKMSELTGLPPSRIIYVLMVQFFIDAENRVDRVIEELDKDIF